MDLGRRGGSLSVVVSLLTRAIHTTVVRRGTTMETTSKRNKNLQKKGTSAQETGSCGVQSPAVHSATSPILCTKYCYNILERYNGL